jgi:multidrug resistance protein
LDRSKHGYPLDGPSNLWEQIHGACELAEVVAVNEVSRSSVGLRSERGPVLLAVMLSMGLVAIDSTILATAVPAIVGDLGGFTQFPWLFSVYLLAQAVTVPIFAKLADLFGRKPVMLAGVGLFLVGSVLCGFAWGMTSLIVFRAVQGLGAGAVQPMAMTIVGDLYTLEERAKVQGYLASVWAISAVVGPTLGGVFADYLSWRWIFFVNVPIALAAGWMLWRRFEERVERQRHRIDYAGSVLLSAGGVLLLLGLLEGGVRGPPPPASPSSRSPPRCSWRSPWWSDARPSRCCPAGSSGTGCSWPPC